MTTKMPQDTIHWERPRVPLLEPEPLTDQMRADITQWLHAACFAEVPVVEHESSLAWRKRCRVCREKICWRFVGPEDSSIRCPQCHKTCDALFIVRGLPGSQFCGPEIRCRVCRAATDMPIEHASVDAEKLAARMRADVSLTPLAAAFELYKDFAWAQMRAGDDADAEKANWREIRDAIDEEMAHPNTDEEQRKRWDAVRETLGPAHREAPRQFTPIDDVD
jgi:hypothetical protein